MRGNDPELYAKYYEAFEKRSAEVSQGLTEMRRQAQELGLDTKDIDALLAALDARAQQADQQHDQACYAKDSEHQAAFLPLGKMAEQDEECSDQKRSQVDGRIEPHADGNRQRLARLLRVDERALLSGYTSRRPRPDRPRRAEPTARQLSQAPGTGLFPFLGPLLQVVQPLT